MKISFLSFRVDRRDPYGLLASAPDSSETQRTQPRENEHKESIAGASAATRKPPQQVHPEKSNNQNATQIPLDDAKGTSFGVGRRVQMTSTRKELDLLLLQNQKSVDDILSSLPDQLKGMEHPEEAKSVNRRTAFSMKKIIRTGLTIYGFLVLTNGLGLFFSAWLL